MALDRDVAFIGAGNMASALIEGLIASGTCSAERIVASDPEAGRLASLRERLGIVTVEDNTTAVLRADIVVLSTKPQVFASVLPELAPQLGADRLVVSIAAGVPLEVIEGELGGGVRVVRAMPNTPALVRAGATALAAGTRATDADMAAAERIFAAVGITVRVPELLMDAVTATSGSGPAYVFALVEALAEAAARVGLPAGDAAQLARQTVIGAARLLEQTGEAPEALRARVTSPGGTTEAGLASLAQGGFTGVIAEAVAAATARGRELGEQARRRRRDS